MTGVSTLQDGSNRIAGHSSSTPLEDVGDGKHRDVRVFPRGSLAVTLVDPAGDTVSGGGGGGGDGTIIDGVDDNIKATVLDLTNANPLAVAITDANGDQLTSFGGGTEYTEDAAAPANPVGGALLLRRDDDVTHAVSDDDDWIAAKADASGALRVFDQAAEAAITAAKNVLNDINDKVVFGVDAVEQGEAVTQTFGLVPAAVAITTPSNVTDVADGDGVLLRATRKGELHAKITDAVPVTDNGGALTVDNGGTFPVQVSSALPAGTNNIGDVDIASALPAGTNNIGDVDVASLPATPAGTNLIGSVSAKLATDAIMNGTTALTPKFAVIDFASSGDNTLVAAVNPKKIRVLSAFLVSAGTVTVRFESGASGTALTGQMSLVANSGFTLPFNPTGWFETASNTLLNLELSGNVSVDGCLTYVEV